MYQPLRGGRVFQLQPGLAQSAVDGVSETLPIAPRISIYSEDDAGWYVLEIITFNRRYLLANIAEVLSDFDISVRYAKIATLDERVEDSFLIYAPTLEDTKQQLALKKALLAQISS